MSWPVGLSLATLFGLSDPSAGCSLCPAPDRAGHGGRPPPGVAVVEGAKTDTDFGDPVQWPAGGSKSSPSGRLARSSTYVMVRLALQVTASPDEEPFDLEVVQSLPRAVISDLPFRHRRGGPLYRGPYGRRGRVGRPPPYG